MAIARDSSISGSRDSCISSYAVALYIHIKYINLKYLKKKIIWRIRFLVFYRFSQKENGNINLMVLGTIKYYLFLPTTLFKWQIKQLVFGVQTE